MISVRSGRDGGSVSVFQVDVARGSQWDGGNYAQLLEPQAGVGRNFGRRTRSWAAFKPHGIL